MIAADLADPDAVTRAHAAVVAALGPVDVLVNNAGANTRQRHLHELAGDGAGARAGREPGGAVPLLDGGAARHAGEAGRHADPYRVRVRRGAVPGIRGGYGASKAGVNMMSAHINAEEGVHGIRSICINPGEVATDILDRGRSPPSAADRALMLQAEDVAAAAVFAPACLSGRPWLI